MTAPLPPTHLDLLERPVVGVLTTLMPDGQPQSSIVWVDHDGEHACISTTLQRRKGRNLANDPRVTLLVVDPEDTNRFLQIRGRVELVQDGAIEEIDRLARRYARHEHFYGGVYPVEAAGRETRVTCRIHAERITCDAIHR
ncbi:MAG: PPOX class F420-dependent oxidoreductase [Gaiellaceae bacterium]